MDVQMVFLWLLFAIMGFFVYRVFTLHITPNINDLWNEKTSDG